MKSRPIIFSAPMVRSLLAGAKTQTRRIVKPKKVPDGHWMIETRGARHELTHWDNDTAETSLLPCPYGQPGDQLWVRETWGFNPDFPHHLGHICYRADPEHEYDGIKWKPGGHMPHRASRITLEITGVRVERLRDISADDALAEGVKVHPDHHRKPPSSIYSPVQAYRDLWESINGPGSWDLNPRVWVIEFRRLP